MKRLPHMPIEFASVVSHLLYQCFRGNVNWLTVGYAQGVILPCGALVNLKLYYQAYHPSFTLDKVVIISYLKIAFSSYKSRISDEMRRMAVHLFWTINKQNNIPIPTSYKAIPYAKGHLLSSYHSLRMVIQSQWTSKCILLPILYRMRGKP